MKKNLLLILLLFPVISLLAQKSIYNDPNAEVRKLSGSFQAIKVSNAIDVYLSQGEEEAIAVSAINEEQRNRIKLAVEEGVLKIWFDNKDNWWKNNGNRKLKVYVSFKNLIKLTASGASDVKTNGGIKLNELDLNFSGASDFDGEITANELNVDISGASDVKIKKGKVTNLKIRASGASEFTGYDLIADNCTADASGASDIKITVNIELNARASGASGIYYKGEGKIRDLKSNGASTVSRRS
ncbi:MAG: head GIN domain-containing protein [Chitinophagaceae bacterium]